MLKYSFFGLILAVDQLLLPMFHIGGIPIKPSYVLLGVWFLGQFINNNQNVLSKARQRDFRRLALAFGGIIASALLGDFILRANFQVAFAYETIRNILIYALIVLSFGLGQCARQFDMRWLIRILYISLALNLLVTVFGNYAPWLLDFYYGASAYSSPEWQEWGITSREILLERGRPLGLFGSPTISMLQIDIIFLFVVIAQNHRLLPRPSFPGAFAITVLPVALTIVYGARSEFPVALTLGTIFAYSYWGEALGRIRGKLIIAFATLLVLSTLLLLPQIIGDESDIGYNATRMVNLLQGEDERLRLDTAYAPAILRPLITLDIAFERFLFSPLFGSGFNVVPIFPFDYSVAYFHNDWFFVLVTSGLIGFGIWLWIIRIFCMPIGWLALFPYFLPGLTNTFVLAIPSVMFYFFMIGLLRDRLRAGTVAGSIRESGRRVVRGRNQGSSVSWAIES